MDKIRQVIEKQFETNRVVFWYDEFREFLLDFESLDIGNIRKIRVENNEFGLKHKILIEEPNIKFLLYFTDSRPPIEDNWLADLLLANSEVHIDQASITLSDLELGREFIDLIHQHEFFFKSAKRTADLKKLLSGDDTLNRINWKMLAVCCSSDTRWDEVIMNLLSEVATDKAEKYELVCKSSLDVFLWEQIKKLLGYVNPNPSIKDFYIELFNSAYYSALGEKVTLNNEAIYLLKRFKDHNRHRKAFRILSEQCSEWLNIEQELLKRELKELLEPDYFELIELKVLSDLALSIFNGTYNLIDVEKLIRQRMLSHWYEDYLHEYSALESASNLLAIIRNTDLKLHSFEEGLDKYQSHWYKLDYHYRKFIYHSTKAKQPNLLNSIYEEIENHYLNKYLFPLSTAWSAQIKQIKQYRSISTPLQSSFWQRQIVPYLETGKKIFVIISDALRYEIASELLSLIRQEDRYEADLCATLGMLPSYTQLGMAALLPHKTIGIAEDESGNVLIDGMSSMGSENRTKILHKYTDGKALLLKADEALSKTSEESKKLYRDYDVIYILQNRIDAMGDDRESETKVFEAVETAQGEIIEIMRKLTSGNANNIIITSDHGFLYQHRQLEESDFVSEADISGNVLYRDRRFILGKELNTKSALMHFRSEQLACEGNMEVLLPLANQRLRLKGSGSRYVHGGASLQEIVVPLIKVNKKRTSDVDFVSVEFLSGSGRIISTGQLIVNLYQKEPVSDKMQPITLKIGIYTIADELISEERTIPFDYVSENPREREFQCSLILSTKAEKANNQSVILKLEKPIPGTNRYQVYKTESYTLRRSFTSDFDF